MRTRTPSIRSALAIATAALVTAGLLAAAPGTAGATPGPASTSASGPDWTIVPVAGGYQVSLELDEQLPVVDDAPTLVVDGEDYGIATESADGLTLSVITSDASVADADDVEMGWASGAESHVMPTDSPVTSRTAPSLTPVRGKLARARALADGGTPGSFSYIEDDYDFGDQTIPMAGLGGIRGELTGRIYLPTSGGARPTVILLHGRHGSCAGSPSNPNRWPCGAAQTEIPSYKGYDALGQLLATHGYAVVSISANAINANDAQLSLDNGALARGQLVIDSLELLKKANAGAEVSYYDAAKTQTLTLDQALASTTADTSGRVPPGALTAADLVGRFDLTNVGLMGHSRGGEGVVSAVTLNQALAQPFGINSVLPLAPVDFARMTVADTDMLTILPYCDGDVSNQQGQHFPDDSRYAFDDNALRSTVWVMGANHNFFNTVWTPGLYPFSTSDDWGANSTDTVCGPRGVGNQRLSATDQYNTGAVVMAAWFRLTMGGDDEFLPMFDGTVKPTLDSVPAADLRTIATAPAADRADIQRFTEASPAITTTGGATAQLCASAAGRTTPQVLPACATANSFRTTSGMPHWTPASFAGNVPASPMTRFLWTADTDTLAVAVPSSARNVGAFTSLSFNTAPNEAVLDGTDLRVTLVDGAGATWSTLTSAVNPLAVKRMPKSTSTTLNKIVLQQVTIPVSSITGINLSDVREVRFSGATGLDGTASGGVYLTDLALFDSAIGTPVVAGSWATLDVAPVVIEEGDAAGTHTVPVLLSRPVGVPVTAWFTSVGSTTAGAKVPPGVQKVTFQPGETCVSATFPTLGDDVASSAPTTTTFKYDVSVPSGPAITGSKAFANLTIREDDGTTGATPPIPAVGEQGDACAEYEARSSLFGIVPSQQSVTDGAPVSLTATGYRVGETVTFMEGATPVGTAIAGPDGSATVTTSPTGLGEHRYTASGAGSQRSSAVTVFVLVPTTTSLAMSPATPSIKQPVTLTATVTGSPSPGVVTFTDGGTTLGTATVVDGTAVLTLPGGFSVGSHTVTATLAATEATTASTSDVIAFTLVKGTTSTVLALSSPSTTYGTGATGTVTIAGADGGTVTIGYDDTVLDLPVGPDGTASFELPTTLGVGSYEVTASYSGSETVEASTAATAPYEVTLAGSTTTVQAKGTVRKGKSLTVAVTVTGVEGVAAPSGTVAVTFAGVTKTVTLVDGVGSTGFRATKAGKRKVSVVYAGDESYAGSSTSKAVTVLPKK